MFKISVLVSGAGTTLDNLAHHCYDESEGMIRGFVEISRVVADRPCKALEVAEKWGLPNFVIPKREPVEEWSNDLFVNFPDPVDLHVMGGFLSQVHVPEGLDGRILNIHPSMLPAYGGKGMYGIHVHKAVVEAREKVTGISVHTVTNVYDDGILLGQLPIAVLPWDTAESLMYNVQEKERLFYPRVILNYLLKSAK